MALLAGFPRKLVVYQCMSVVLFLLCVVGWRFYLLEVENSRKLLEQLTTRELEISSLAVKGPVAVAAAGVTGKKSKFVPKQGGDVILWESFDEALLYTDERIYKVQ